MTKILLTGEGWGEDKGKTVEADSGANENHASWDDRFVCLPECGAGELYAGIEVPFLIGEKVRLTAVLWGSYRGDTATVVDYEEDADGECMPLLDNSYYVCDGWEVEPVEEFSAGITLECLRDMAVTSPMSLEEVYGIARLASDLANTPVPTLYGFDKKPAQHPNFIEETTEEGGVYTAYYETYPQGSPETPWWTLGDTHVQILDDIKGLRKVLDEIERRMEDES